jgi:Transglycosylase SLT domain
MMRPIALTLLVALAGCGGTGEPAGPAGSPAAGGRDALSVADWDQVPQGTAWTALLETALEEKGADLLAAEPSDVAEFCPGFAALASKGRQAFYVGLISRMARFESNFNPNTNFTESFPDSQGRPVVSRGLLQLSIESANAYPGCTLENPEQLHDPATNLDCGVVILNRLVSRDQAIGRRVDGRWRGGAAYWSVLRPPRRAEVSAFTADLEVCRPA